MRSESCWFIWQPNVTMLKLGMGWAAAQKPALRRDGTRVFSTPRPGRRANP
jgi:hypothetical protein